MSERAGRGPGPGVRPPLIAPRPALWLWLAALVVALAAPLCLGVTHLGAARVDLVHATLFISCSSRAYEVHWQDQRRYPQPIRYDFMGSPVSFALLEIWIENGPTISLNRHLALRCPVWPGSSNQHHMQ